MHFFHFLATAGEIQNDLLNGLTHFVEESEGCFREEFRELEGLVGFLDRLQNVRGEESESFI